MLPERISLSTHFVQQFRRDSRHESEGGEFNREECPELRVKCSSVCSMKLSSCLYESGDDYSIPMCRWTGNLLSTNLGISINLASGRGGILEETERQMHIRKYSLPNGMRQK